MAIGPATFNDAKHLTGAALDGEDPTAVEETLLDWLRIWIGASFVDDESIWFAGQLVGGSRHSGIDTAVQRKLAADPAAQTVAGDFLRGYWAWKPVAREFDLEAFARALDTSAPEEPVYAATALALYSAVTNDASGLDPEMRRRLREKLLAVRTILASKGLYPGVLVYLDYLVKLPRSAPR